MVERILRTTAESSTTMTVLTSRPLGFQVEARSEPTAEPYSLTTTSPINILAICAGGMAFRAFLTPSLRSGGRLRETCASSAPPRAAYAHDFRRGRNAGGLPSALAGGAPPRVP